jgi:hypothetical protein
MLTNTIQEIANVLPDGLSSEGMEEISQLLESYVDEKVSSEVSNVEAQIASLFRTKIDDLKEIAYKELITENSNMKAIKYFDSIMGIVSDYVDSEMIDGKLAERDVIIAEQADQLVVLETHMQEMLTENSKLTQLLDMSASEKEQLNEQLITASSHIEELDTQLKEDFVSSEKAVIITNKDNPNRSLLEGIDNPYLNEEILNITNSVLHS